MPSFLPQSPSTRQLPTPREEASAALFACAKPLGGCQTCLLHTLLPPTQALRVATKTTPQGVSLHTCFSRDQPCSRITSRK